MDLVEILVHLLAQLLILFLQIDHLLQLFLVFFHGLLCAGQLGGFVPGNVQLVCLLVRLHLQLGLRWQVAVEKSMLGACIL